MSERMTVEKLEKGIYRVWVVEHDENIVTKTFNAKNMTEAKKIANKFEQDCD